MDNQVIKTSQERGHWADRALKSHNLQVAEDSIKVNLRTNQGMIRIRLLKMKEEVGCQSLF